jgi:hypothetical protein
MDTPAWQRTAYRDAAAKLTNYYCPATTTRFTQPAVPFLQTVRLFDPQQAKTLTFNDFFNGIPTNASKRRTISDELAAYKRYVAETNDEVQPVEFWFSCRDRFPELFELAIKYLSVPVNSVDAERSVSQYTMVNAPQRQAFTNSNLAMHVMMAHNSRT